MKRILALVLTIVMLFSMVACDFFSKPKNNSNENTTPQVTVTEPEGTQPEGTQPEGTQPEGTEPEGTEPEGTEPGTEPGTNPGVTPDFEIELPKASELIANIIGVVAATVEVSKDAQIVFVVEQDDESNDYNGFKQVLFLEVVEASVDSDGEVLKAHLKVKVGDACVDIPENGSANDLVVGKNDIVSYYEISVDVDGDNVSYSFNEENASADLSELLWGTVANMMGLSGIEELKQVIKTAYIAQELEKYLIPIIAQAIEGVFQELPTVSPAYGEHVAELFAALGQDIITVTVDDVTGYTTYSLNIAAFKALIADIEDKTLAEYLEGIYGENVVGALSEFLKTLPEKKVKDIVDAAVALAEGTGATIEEIYALIDLYVLNATGVEFSIEEQINERYNNTLIELLAEMSSIAPEDQETFVEGIKTSFTQAAEVIETVKVDALLSSMFLGAEEGFFEGLKATIDMFDEQITYSYTVDEAGFVVAINYAIGEVQYNLTVEGEDTVLNVVLPGGVAIRAIVSENGFNFVVTENEEQVASGSLTVTEETDEEDVTATTVVDVQNSTDDLVDFTLVKVNGVVTELDVVIRDYNVERNTHYYPYPVDFFEVTETKELVEVFVVEYANDGTVVFNAIIKAQHGSGMGCEESETGEYSETWVEEWFELVSIAYNDLGDGTATLNLLFSETFGIQINQENNESTVDITIDGETVGNGRFAVTSELVDDQWYETIEAELREAENELLNLSMVYVDDVLVQFDLVINGYYTESEWVETPKNEQNEQDEYFGGSLEAEKGENSFVIVTPMPEGGMGDGENDFVIVMPNPDGTMDGFEDDYTAVVRPVEPNGEWVSTTTFVNWLTISYDNVDDASILHINAHESIISVADDIVITVENNQVSAVLSKNGEVVTQVTFSSNENGLSVEVTDGIDTVFQAGFEIINNFEGEDFIRVEYQGVAVLLGYKADENGVKFAVYDESGENVLSLFEIVTGDESVAVKVLLGENLDGVVTFIPAEDGLTIDIDLDQFLLYDYGWSKSYIAFDGAITIQILNQVA